MEHLLVTSSPDGCLATVTLNRPSLRNAFNSKTIDELQQTFRRLGSDPKVRCVVITGQGDVFCGGADINWMRASRDFTLDKNRRDAAVMASMFATLARMPKITLARVNGLCYGGANGLVAACDIAIASSEAAFAFSEVKLGISPAVIAPYVLNKLGHGTAQNLFLRGAPFTAAEACRYGLVHRVVEPAELDEAIEAEVVQLRSSAPQACAETKALLRQLPTTPPDRVEELTVGIIARLRSGVEGQEGLAAFLEKRKPAWALTPEEGENREES